ncbi:MAG: hypothetical protein IKF90_10470 [Parasporobacterium sp.]|nr:hypothetical protein [Parasporobacterium sp.]
MAEKEQKTNAMRILEKMNIPFSHQEYESSEKTALITWDERVFHESVIEWLQEKLLP